MDDARKWSDKKLKSVEAQIDKIYRKDPAIKKIYKEYSNYMDTVQKRTETAYKAFVEETDKDIKAEKKKAYTDELTALTVNSKEYKQLVHKFAQTMAKVNQSALNIVNDTMADVYAKNYNEVATECKRVGIKVNG